MVTVFKKTNRKELKGKFMFLKNYKSIIKILCLIFFITLFSACSDISQRQKKKKQLPLESKKKTVDIIYKVEAGDTLSKLAIRFYNDKDGFMRIAENNGIQYPYRLFPNQILKIQQTAMENNEIVITNTGKKNLKTSNCSYAKKLYVKGSYEMAKMYFIKARRNGEDCNQSDSHIQNCDRALTLLKLIDTRDNKKKDLLRYYEKLYSINSEDPKALFELSEIYYKIALTLFKQGNYQKAHQNFKKSKKFYASEKSKQYLEKCETAINQIKISEQCIRAKNFRKAIEELEKLLKLNAEDTKAQKKISYSLFQIGKNFFDQGDYKEAEKKFNKATTYGCTESSNYLKNIRKASRALTAGENFLSTDHFFYAINEFEKVLKLNKLDKKALRLLDTAHLKRGKKFFNEYGSGFPNDNNINSDNQHKKQKSTLSKYFIGKILDSILSFIYIDLEPDRNTGYEIAINEFKKVSDYRNKADCFLSIQKSKIALDAYKRAIKLYQSQDYKNAIESFLIVIEQNKLDQNAKNLLNETYFSYASNLFIHEKYDEAEMYFKKVEPLHSKYVQAVVFIETSQKAAKKIIAAKKEENYKQSIPLFEDVLNMNKDAKSVKIFLHNRYRRWGDELFRKGSYKDSKQKYELALNYSKTSSNSLNNRIETCNSLSQFINESKKYFENNEFTKCIILLNKILEKNQKDRFALKFRADSYFKIGLNDFKSGNYTTAEKNFTMVMNKSSLEFIEKCQKALNLISLGKSSLTVKDFNAAIENFSNLLTTINKEDKNVKKLLSQSYYQKGLVLFKNGEYREAEDFFLKGQNFDIECYECKQYLKKSTEALRRIELGIDYKKLEKFKRAISNFNKAYKINPNDNKVRSYLKESHFSYAMNFFTQSKYSEAKRHFKESAKYETACSGCQSYIQKCDFLLSAPKQGYKHYDNNQFNESIRIFSECIQKNPDDLEIKEYLYNSYFYLGKLLFDKGGYAESKKRFDDAKKYNSKCYKCDTYSKLSSQAGKRMNDGVDFYKKGEFKRAIDEFQKVIKINAYDKNASTNICNSYLQIGQKDYYAGNYSKSKKSLTEALTYNDDCSDCQNYIDKNTRTETFLSQGIERFNNEEYMDSIKSLKNVLNLNDNDKKAIEYINKSSIKLFEKYIQKADDSFKQGDYSACISECENALKLKPDCQICDFRKANVKKGKCNKVSKILKSGIFYSKNHDNSNASKEFKKVLKLNPYDLNALFFLKNSTEVINKQYFKKGNEFFKNSKYDLAKNNFLRIDENFEDYLEVEKYIDRCDQAIRSYVKAKKYLKNKNYDSAINEYKSIIDKINKNDTLAKKYISNSYLRKANQFFIQANYTKAKKEITKAIQYKPSCKECDKLLDKCHDAIKTKKLKNTADKWSKMIQINPYDSKAFFMRGKVLFNQGDYDEAENDFQKAISSRNTDKYIQKCRDIILLYTKISNLLNGENFSSAITHLEKILTINPNDRKAARLIDRTEALLAYNDNSYNKSKEIFEKIQKQGNCEDCKEFINKSKSLIRLKKLGEENFSKTRNYSAAIKNFEDVLEINPEDKSAAHFLYRAEAITLYHEGKYTKAISKYRKAIDILPCKQCEKKLEICGKLENKKNEGNSYFDKLQYKKAIKLFDEVQKSNPSDVEAKTYLQKSWKKLGNDFFNEQKYDEAIDAYENKCGNDSSCDYDKDEIKHLYIANFHSGKSAYENEDYTLFKKRFLEYRKHINCDECPGYLKMFQTISDRFKKSEEALKNKSKKGKLFEAIKGFGLIYVINPKYQGVEGYVKKIETLIQGLFENTSEKIQKERKNKNKYSLLLNQKNEYEKYLDLIKTLYSITTPQKK